MLAVGTNAFKIQENVINAGNAVVDGFNSFEGVNEVVETLSGTSDDQFLIGNVWYAPSLISKPIRNYVPVTKREVFSVAPGTRWMKDAGRMLSPRAGLELLLNDSE